MFSIYSFKSKAAKERHYSLIHNRLDNENIKIKKCTICAQEFQTLAALTKHKKEKGHKNPTEKRGRKKKQLID